MKLILTQPEIEQILRDHVDRFVSLATGTDYEIDFVATRSNDGITATIDVPYLGVDSIPEIAKDMAVPTPPPAGPTKRAARAKTVEEVEEVSADVAAAPFDAAEAEPTPEPEPAAEDAPAAPAGPSLFSGSFLR